MSVRAAAGSRASPEALPARAVRTQRPPPFGAALARASWPAAVGARDTSSPPGPTTRAGVLGERRRVADHGELVLRCRREESDLPAGGAPPDAAAVAHPPGADVAAATPLFGAAAVAQVSLLVARSGGRTSVELALGRGVSVAITRTPRGVEVFLHAPPGARRAAEAELPALIGAVRARGVTVARAGVRAGAAGPGGALTSPQGSATTAATLGPGGTVAKW